MKRIAIIQSNYIPWKGYLDIIGSVDAFVLLDDVQFTRRDWRNRNKIVTPQGSAWLTIPVASKGKFEQPICETETMEESWAAKHAASIRQNYARAPYFKAYWPTLETLYVQAEKQTHLSKINKMFLDALCNMLHIDTPIHWSMDYKPEGDKEQRLISLCKSLGATHYLSGPAAAAYIPDGAFEKEGITLEYADYSGYPEYKQIYGAFDHYVSVLDLLFNTGEKAADHMKFRHHKETLFRKAA